MEEDGLESGCSKDKQEVHTSYFCFIYFPLPPLIE